MCTDPYVPNICRRKMILKRSYRITYLYTQLNIYCYHQKLHAKTGMGDKHVDKDGRDECDVFIGVVLLQGEFIFFVLFLGRKTGKFHSVATHNGLEERVSSSVPLLPLVCFVYK